MRVYGTGLLKGLKVTFKHFFDRKLTEQYPEERPKLYPRFRGRLYIEPEKCIVCSICVRTCPNGVLSLEEGRDETAKKKRLLSYEIDHQYCMFCNVCVENCPAQCLHFNHEFEWATFSRDQLKVVYQGPAPVEGKETPAPTAVQSQPQKAVTGMGEKEADSPGPDDKREKKKEALKTALAKNPAKVLGRYLENQEEAPILAAFLQNQPQRADKLVELMAEDEDKARKVAEALLKQAKKQGLGETGGESR